MKGHPNSHGTGVKFCGFQCAWLQPIIILAMISFVYCVYVGLNLLPALQSINASSMNDASHDLISNAPAFQSFLSDPHATRWSFTAFVIATLGFHVLLIMFAMAFIKAMVTPPGSVPVEKQSDRMVNRYRQTINEPNM